MTGTVGILNVGAGDTKLVFDNSNPMETARAARIVKDMIRRGYALFVEVATGDGGKPEYRRAHDFDEKTAEYIIADFDPIAAEQADQEEHDAEKQASPEAPATAAPALKASPGRGRRGGARKRVPAASTGAVAVARTAGG